MSELPSFPPSYRWKGQECDGVVTLGGDPPALDIFIYFMGECKTGWRCNADQLDITSITDCSEPCHGKKPQLVPFAQGQELLQAPQLSELALPRT